MHTDTQCRKRLARIDRCHTKAIITKPQNVCIMRDIMSSGYVAGGNTKFFGETQQDKSGNGITPRKVKDAMNKRLAFEDDASGDYESMFAFCAPIYDGAKRDQVISVSDRILPWEAGASEDKAKDYFPGGTNNYNAVKLAFELHSIHFGVDMRADQGQDYISQGSRNNALCFVGPYRKYSPFSQNLIELVPGQGHFGPDAIPGDVSCNDRIRFRAVSVTLRVCVLRRRAGVAASRCRSRRRVNT